MKTAHLVVASMLYCAPQMAIASEKACVSPNYVHGIAHLLPPKYDAEFTHFDYANPSAPKMGEMRLPSLGTFDNFNYILEKGRLADGYAGGLVYDTLLEYAIDETTAAYGRLAEGIAIGPDLDWVAFKIRKNAIWHDGQPITVDDVIFTFETMKKHGSVAIRTALFDLDRIFAFGDREVCFVRKKDVEINPILPFVFGGYGILPKHYWDRHDVTKTTLEPPLVSGPYRLESYELGRILKYERVHDYWGRDLPVNKGRYNFDHLKWDYFTDDNVMGEAHKAHVFDVREEGVSKNWATQYNFPAVRKGLFKRDLRPTARVEGLWWPIIWNTDRPKLGDIRVREALWLLFDFDWTNRALFYDFYDKGVSFFQNSPMAHDGLPDEKELSLLEPWRDQIPARVFTEAFRHPPSDGFGPQRQNIKRSLELFAEAGWEVRDGVMRNNETGDPFTLDFIAVSYYGIRQNLSLVQNLDRVGIETRGKAPEVSQWLYRSRTGKFDGNSVRLGPSHTPGLQLRNWLGSAAADQDYGQNWSRIRNPAIDSLINSIISAKTAEGMYAAARALGYLKLFEDQMKYPTPGSHHYSIETLDGRFIGNCMYYDLDTVNREAELGIVIGDRDYWSDGYGYDAVTTLLHHMFTIRNLKRVYLHTLEWNDRAQKSFSKSGFNAVRPVRRMAHDFILMDVLRDDWFATCEERLAARFKDLSPNSPPCQTTAD